MKIAVVGAGVSGLVTALLLDAEHEVTVFEAEDYIGGHTHTIDVPLDGGHAVDIGFIVFNYENYPKFARLLQRLDVGARPSSMSFSVVNRVTGMEYGFATLNALFAQRRNLLRPSFLRMLWDIRRFRGEFDRLIRELDDEVELGVYLDRHGYSKAFRRDFLIPFGSAIWSASPTVFEKFPLRTFVQFFLNHGFLDVRRLLQWYVVEGGSRTYVDALLARLRGKVHASAPVASVQRVQDAVRVTVQGAEPQRFDQVVLACHGDQALAMLADPTPAERAIIGALPYQPNDVVLHTDTSVLPAKRHVWSSWNYEVTGRVNDRATLTYDMNILQGHRSRHEFLVTLNPDKLPAEDAVISRHLCYHPVYTVPGVVAQARYDEIGGMAQRTHYAGAYWGYGFHEDGVESALRVCKAFGQTL